jgi:hypothetical protein
MRNILIACECSGIVREAFASRGWNAWSCDLKPSEMPGQHYQGDMFNIVCDSMWDIIIAHSPCTYLSVSGNGWYVGTQERAEAVKFVERIYEAVKVPLAIENPVGVLSTMSKLGRATQYIQPWEFGHGETKKTGLWLRGLPKLKPTNIVDGRENRIWKMPQSANRQTERSRTYTGIAAAMADQWGA